MTINETMVLVKVIKERLHDLKELRLSTAIKTKLRRGYGDSLTEEESDPQYDTKMVDRRITELQNWLFRADAMIKQSNARTELPITADVEKLLAPLE